MQEKYRFCLKDIKAWKYYERAVTNKFIDFTEFKIFASQNLSTFGIKHMYPLLIQIRVLPKRQTCQGLPWLLKSSNNKPTLKHAIKWFFIFILDKS